MKISKLLILNNILVVLLLISCVKEEKVKVDPKFIVAIVDEDTIFVNDIIRRSEYTVRPPYCDSDQLYDKRVILNSIIAEILYAKETSSKNVFESNQKYHAQLKGLKEQLMREKLIQKDVVEKINIPQEEIDQAYINSKKIINTEAVFIPKGFDPEVMYNAARKGIEFSQFSELYPGVSKVIEKSIKWGSIDEEAQEAIFNIDVKKGTVLKPLQTKDGYRLVKITGWVEELELSPGNVNQMKESIRAKIRDHYIQTNYLEYAQNVMKGKRIDFYKDGWERLIYILEPIYLKLEDRENSPKEIEFNKTYHKNKNIALMNVDGENWTIEKLFEAAKVHPLEINLQSISKENFPYKLQSAIASLITDINLTDIAYERGYDNTYDVERAVKQWDIFYKASYQRDYILNKEKFTDTLTISYLKAFNEHLNPYFDKLKRKYDSVIRYNPKSLENLELTSLQTITYKEKGPYKEVVPPFPLITNSNKNNFKRLGE